MNTENLVLSIRNLSKSFRQGKDELIILDNANLDIKRGEMVSLVGSSGSGKTTFLQTAGLLDTPNSGEIFINNHNASIADDRKRTEIRRHNIGFVYQSHHLMPEFSALENIAMPLLIQGESKKKAFEEARDLLNSMGLIERQNHLPAELSGGEQQRVAIARAVIGKPSIIMADEPTGNLDPATSDKVFEVLVKTVKEFGLSSLVVTHNLELAKKMDRVVTIKDGQITAL